MSIAPEPIIIAGLATAGLALLLARHGRPVSRWIPRLTAEGAGLFRIAWGLAFAYIPLGFGDLPTGGSFLQEVVRVLTVAALILFAAGFRARAMHVVGTLGLVAWILWLGGGHDWTPALIAFATGVVIPWSDGFGLDARRLQRAGLEPRPRSAYSYGLAIWLPGLVFGLAFLAAAYAKLHATGIGWALDGAVQYHWVEDARSAPVGLGTWIASHPRVAILAASIGLLAEAVLVLHVFFRSYAIRTLFGLMALFMLSGFFLFQGLFWYGWWALLLAFVPWQPMAEAAGVVRATWPAGNGAAARGLAAPAAAMIGLVVGVQLYASLGWVEHPPLVSNYAMYSHTFESRDAFDAQARRNLSDIRLFDHTSGERLTPQVAVLQADGGRRVVAETVNQALSEAPGGDAEVPMADPSAIDRLWEEYEDRYGDPAPAEVDVRIPYRPFLWEEGRFAPASLLLVATLSDGTVRVPPAPAP